MPVFVGALEVAARAARGGKGGDGDGAEPQGTAAAAARHVDMEKEVGEAEAEDEPHGASEAADGWCGRELMPQQMLETPFFGGIVPRPVAIPMPGEMESLNVAVAGGLLLVMAASAATTPLLTAMLAKQEGDQVKGDIEAVHVARGLRLGLRL